MNTVPAKYLQFLEPPCLSFLNLQLFFLMQLCVSPVSDFGFAVTLSIWISFHLNLVQTSKFFWSFLVFQNQVFWFQKYTVVRILFSWVSSNSFLQLWKTFCFDKSKMKKKELNYNVVIDMLHLQFSKFSSTWLRILASVKSSRRRFMKSLTCSNATEK